MSATHTSLPWTLESIPDLEDGENIEIYDIDGFPIAKIEGEPIISNWSKRFPEMDHWSDGKEDGRTVKERPATEILANAHLFLAAPDLLAACEGARALIRTIDAANPGGFAVGMMLLVLDKAIAKARGEPAEPRSG